jgi:hypothetical protein
MDLNHQSIIESLTNLIISNNNLQELDFSYGNFTLKTFDQILNLNKVNYLKIQKIAKKKM